MRRQIGRVGMVLLASCALSAAQTASPVVDKVTENPAGTTITISGSGFGSTAPKVLLGTTALAVIHAAATSIQADLPHGLARGDYLLTVTNTSSHAATTFSAAIGAVGPA